MCFLQIKCNTFLSKGDFFEYFEIYNNEEISCGNYTKCHGYCVSSDAYCPSDLTCPSTHVKINLYSCAIDYTFTPPSKCSINHECWDGSCLINFENYTNECPTITTCPDNKYKCHDNSCVNSESECATYFECPSFLPIKCPNGECRKETSDCPSLLNCPEMLPMKCNDESCRLLKKDCALPSNDSLCPNTSMIRCNDGSCASSKFLCSTMSTCNKGYVKCWDGNCALKGECIEMKKGKKNTCDDNNLILCPTDFSCRTSSVSCPTGIICPMDSPVKCWDGSCKSNIENCPNFQKCPTGMKSCPDGSCTLEDTCGTHITCSSKAPFKCYDNTCRQNPKDCPEIPQCPAEKPILCWDGRCLASRGDCLAISSCQKSSPVKCPNGLCVKSGNLCEPEEDDCPGEFVKCPDGTCMKSSKHCSQSKCPLNFPYKCKNGMCVSNSENCEKDNGCPFYRPDKCTDGTCINSALGEKCPIITNETECKTNEKRCPDGSCLSKSTTCPSSSGCSVDNPIRCADGTCIKDDGIQSCSIPICPTTHPFKCLNGACVKTSSYCPTEYTHTTSEIPLLDNLNICADSTYAKSYDECKPLFACPENEPFRCLDGTCRSESSECPKMKNGCPENKFRCESGECADYIKSESGELIPNCKLENGCFQSAPLKCTDSGLCVSSSDKCNVTKEDFALSNGCTRDKPIKCVAYKKCVAKEEDCIKETICASNEKMCPDGSCVTSLRKCKGAICKDPRPFSCPEDDDNPCADKIDSCYNRWNCKLETPFRCINGECKRYPPSLLGNLTNSENDEYTRCEIGIQCPEYKPYLCLDGSCKENSKFCNSIEECPESKPYRCFDRTCQISESLCANHKKCPAGNPLQCPNGNCVSSIFDCDDVSCPSWNPINCAIRKCGKKPRDCTVPINDTNLYGSICHENEVQCYDGSCKKDYNECPIYKGCPKMGIQFKCPDGSCSSSEEECPEKYSYNLDLENNSNNNINNQSIFKCPSNTSLCEDGLCRSKCLSFNGCPMSNPLMCSNGQCVKTLSECVGASSCLSSENYFRCSDGSCVSNMENCPSLIREYGETSLMVNIFPHKEVELPIVIGDNNQVICSLNIPSDVFYIKDSDNSYESTEATLRINSIPRSELTDTYAYYDQTRKDDVNSVLKYADLNNTGKIEYEYAVLSTVISINLLENPSSGTQGNIEWKYPILLTFLYTFPHMHEFLINIDETTNKYAKPLNGLEDVCLGKLNKETREWRCSGLSLKTTKFEFFSMESLVNESGIYGIIINPLKNTRTLIFESNWIIENLKGLIIAIVIILLIIGIVIYVFIRIYRYRGKYKKTKGEYQKIENQVNELSRKSSKFMGETLGDIEEGVVFTDNLAFKQEVIIKEDPRHLQLQDIYEKFRKRLKALESNNEILSENLSNIKTEINRMKEYKQYLMKPEIKCSDNKDSKIKGIKAVGPEDLNKYGSIKG